MTEENTDDAPEVEVVTDPEELESEVEAFQRLLHRLVDPPPKRASR